MKPLVFSGIAPSGSPTVGNYLGAIRNWVRDQDNFDNIFCVVDLHAITVQQDPAELRQRTWEIAAILLAAGIDPERCLLFVQSHVVEHVVLTWLLNSVTPVGWLNRMTQFKSKAGSKRESASAALFDYPVLMAADILAYNANYVPVGDDQKQHVELTRDVAERFNATYGQTFVIPKPMIPPVGARIMSLDDPAKKMSKSDPAGALFLLDPPEVIRRKVSRAVTDSLGVIRFDGEQQPGLFNLLSIIQILSGQTEAELMVEFDGMGYRAVKDRVADLVISTLEPVQRHYAEYAAAPERVDDVLRLGADRARQISGPVVAKVQDRIGLRPQYSPLARGSV